MWQLDIATVALLPGRLGGNLSWHWYRYRLRLLAREVERPTVYGCWHTAECVCSSCRACLGLSRGRRHESLLLSLSLLGRRLLFWHEQTRLRMLLGALWLWLLLLLLKRVAHRTSLAEFGVR